MKQCNVYCINLDVTQSADILQRSDKSIKVAFADTISTLVLSRTDVRQPYVGKFAGLEFETFGDMS